MFRPFDTAAALTVLVFISVAAADDEKGEDRAESADLMKLQGTWTPPEEADKPFSMLIKGNKLTLRFRGESVEGTFTVDSSKEPHTMDFMVTGGTAGMLDAFKDKVAKAIYKIEGDKLTWIANEPGKQTRPTKFEDGKDLLLLVLERKKE